MSGAATAMLGSSFTDKITFQNNDSTTKTAGYSPFVEIFAPTNASKNTPLTGLTIQGTSTSVGYQSVILEPQNGTGSIGAINPLTHAWVNAPSGFSAGDTMYVARLLYTSDAADQACA